MFFQSNLLSVLFLWASDVFPLMAVFIITNFRDGGFYRDITDIFVPLSHGLLGNKVYVYLSSEHSFMHFVKTGIVSQQEKLHKYYNLSFLLDYYNLSN